MLNIAIAILSVLDMAILILLPLLDRRLYKNCPQIKAGRFFSNPGYEMPISRFLYSAAGAWLLCLVFISVMVIFKRYGYE